MAQTLRNDRITQCVVAVTLPVLAAAAVWFSLASAEQLAQTSRGIFIGVGVVAVFTVGVVVGRIHSLTHAGGSSGGGPDDSFGEPPPPVPGVDPLEEELQRLIVEEQARLA